MKNTFAENMIFLDKSGAHLAMTRSYGRAESHQRFLHYLAPYARGKNYSIIAVITTDKIVGIWYCEGTIDRYFFTEFISHFLVSILTPDSGIIMDNVDFHKVKPEIELIKKKGGCIFYLPLIRLTFHLLKSDVV